MKLLLTLGITLFCSFFLIGQDNWLEGKLNIGEFNLNDFPSNYDIRINRSIADPVERVGIEILNPDPLGRSIVLTGEGSGQRYIFMSYLNSSYVPNPLTNTAFKAKSGIIFTGGINGLNLISALGNISFTAGGMESIHNRLEITSDGNIGIGTSEPVEKLQIADGDVYIEDIDKGVIMKSPNGSCWRITVGDDGSLITTLLLECPN